MGELGQLAGGVLATVAPTLATALGGPLAGQAVGWIIKSLGLDPTTPAEQVGKTVQMATPDQLLALKTADQAFAVKLQELGVDLERIAAGDRADARARQVSVKDATPARMAYLITAGFFSLLGTLAFHAVPELNQSVLQITLGALAAGFGSCVTFFFGSSASSRAKDEMLYASTPVVAPAKAAH